jgi:hypothetical protein
MLEQTNIGKGLNAKNELGCPSYMPSGTMQLLSAIHKGWQIRNIELAPSWDQYGFIYLVTLRLPFNNCSQQIILPKNPMIEDLLSHTTGGFNNQAVYSFQGAHP